MAKAKRSAARALDWLAVEGVEVRGGRGAASPTSTRATSSAWTSSRSGTGCRWCRTRSCTPSPPDDVDLVISFLFWKRIREPLLSLGRIGCLNFHPAPLPDMRGVGGYNVAVLEGMSEWGVSCHFVDARLRHRRHRRGGALPDRPGHRHGAVGGHGQPGAPVRAVQGRDAARARRRGAAAHAAGRGPVRDRARSSRSCGACGRATTSTASCARSGTRRIPGALVEVDGPRPDAGGRKRCLRSSARLYREGGLGALTLEHMDLRGLRNRESGRGALLHVLRHRARAALPDLRHARAARGALLHELRRHARRAADTRRAATASRTGRPPRSRPRSAAR